MYKFQSWTLTAPGKQKNYQLVSDVVEKVLNDF